MDEQEHLEKIIHKRGKNVVLLLLFLLLFVCGRFIFKAHAFGPLGPLVMSPFGPGLIAVSVIVSAFTALLSLIFAIMGNPPGTPYERLTYHRSKLAGILLVLGVAHAVMLPFLVAALQQTLHAGSEVAGIVSIPLLECALVGAFIVIYRLFRPCLLDAEGRVVSDATIKANLDPHGHWKWWGYYNPGDSDATVDRWPGGIGVTLNWARRDNLAVMGYLGAFILFVILAMSLALGLSRWIGSR